MGAIMVNGRCTGTVFSRVLCRERLASHGDAIKAAPSGYTRFPSRVNDGLGNDRRMIHGGSDSVMSASRMPTARACGHGGRLRRTVDTLSSSPLSFSVCTDGGLPQPAKIRQADPVSTRTRKIDTMAATRYPRLQLRLNDLSRRTRPKRRSGGCDV